ncbi:arginine/serine-rich protein 1 [Lampris incognitus]|uniref:arginine/serine-rich protein 1 n=1 Tax=Lampris incognitus TaxID=2546036 RepID=UPI0024B4F009|nr:arginine/serine-rich protein 1 [Lampris incognitus]
MELTSKMMTKEKNSLSEMAVIRQREGINVIFVEDTRSSSASPQPRSRSRSRSSHDSGSSGASRRRHHARRTCRGRHRSSSSSSSNSSTRSSFRSRSRSHPRCHRNSSRCRCCSHRRYGHRHQHRRSPPRRYRAHSRSYSRSPSPHRSLSHKSYRSRSRSGSQRRVNSLFMGQHGLRFSPSKSYRSRSRSSDHSVVRLNSDGKRERLKAAKSNATKIFATEQVELPESVKPTFEEQSARLAEPETWVRPEPVSEKSPSQDKEMESDEDVPSPKMSPKRKSISFSIHNSVAKPTVVPPNCAKVTSRVDSYESRKPYGHWVPVRKTAPLSRKYRVTTSR